MGLADIVGDIFGSPNTNVNVPGASPDAAALTGLQTNALQKQSKLSDLLLPYELKNLGLEGTFDANGNLTNVSETADAQAQRDLQSQFLKLSLAQLQSQASQQPITDQITSALNQRTLDALNGKLPVSSQLTRELGDQETILNEQLRKQLGSGYATSDPGIRALATFNQRKAETIDSATRGDLSLADQLAAARSAGTFGTGVSSADLAAQLRGSSLSTLGALPNAFTPFLSNVATPLNQDLALRGLGTQANAASAAGALKAYGLNLSTALDIGGLGLGKVFGSGGGTPSDFAV